MARTTPGTGIPVPESPDPRTITADLWASFSKVGSLLAQAGGESAAAMETAARVEAKVLTLKPVTPVVEGTEPPNRTDVLWYDTDAPAEPPTPGPQGASITDVSKVSEDTMRVVIEDPTTGDSTTRDLLLPRGVQGIQGDLGPRGLPGPEGPYGGTEVTDPQVASYVTSETATRVALDRAYRRTITPGEFGAVGDGLADDTVAVLAVITDGRPVHWGSGTYRITSPIEVTATRPTIWTAESARIVADFAQVATYMLTIHAAGHDVSIRGTLTFDAAKRAHTCVRFWTRFARASLIAEDLRAVRAYRSVLALIGGDGIEVGGAWDRVHLTRPTVSDVGMAAGAGASGAKGVSGIYIHEINKTGGADVPYDIRIMQPMITDIYSEDPAWKVDQDGIRVFGAPETTGGAIPTIAVIQGGEVRNSLGRAVKAQTPNVSVEGLKIVRDKGGQGTQYDIDFQLGGGTVTDVECEYRGAAPDAVVSASGNRDNSLTPQTVIAGLKVSLSGGAALPKVVLAASYAELFRSISIRDVIVKGGTPGVIALIAGVSDGKVYLAMSGVVAAAGTSFVRIQAGSPNGWDLELSASACINTGTPVPLVTTHTSLARISAVSSALVRLT